MESQVEALNAIAGIRINKSRTVSAFVLTTTKKHKQRFVKSFGAIFRKYCKSPHGLKGILDTKPINQSCVFPTIFDLPQIKTEWRGVEQSIFMPDSIRYSPYERERHTMKQTISDYILYKNYL